MTHRTLILACLALASAVVAEAKPPTAPASRRPSVDWTPPVGVPAPSFGIHERAGAATCFVDNSHPAATDEGNPLGSAARPRQTVPSTLPAGTVVEVRGGPYAARRHGWTADGKEGSPVFVRGVGSPVFTGGDLWLQGSYLVAEGIVLEGAPLLIGPGHDISVRRSEIRGFDPGRNGAAVSMAASNVVLAHNHIHHNGNPSAGAEEDVHGIKLSTGSSRVWIVDNHIHHNGGDAIQIGSARAWPPWAQYVYIARNELHDDRENGVDVKQARDVVVSENRIYSYAPTSSSSGEAVVVHNGPERVWVLDNWISDAAFGVVCTGAASFFAVGNAIHRIHHAPGQRYDPKSLYGSRAILVYGSDELHAVANTLFDVDAGISVPNGGRAVVVDNIVAGLAQPSAALAVRARESTTSHNLLAQHPSGNGADPLAGGFRDATGGDFRLRAGSAAIDAGTIPDAYAVFKRTYGLDIARDLASTPRPQGLGFDIGALEYLPDPQDP